MSSKLREALERSTTRLKGVVDCYPEIRHLMQDQIAENEAALAEPVRNCDVGTAEEQFGNAAKMREVVYGIKNTANSALTALSIGNDMSSFLWDIIRKCEAALSKPARNCDLYEKEDEASKEFIVWYNTVYDLYGDKWGEVSSCDLKHNIDDILHRYIDWLFAEAKAKGE